MRTVVISKIDSLGLLEKKRPVFAIKLTTSTRVDNGTQDVQLIYLIKLLDDDGCVNWHTQRKTYNGVTPSSFARIYRVLAKYYRNVSAKAIESNPEYWNATVWKYSLETQYFANEALNGDAKATALLKGLHNKSW